MNILLVSMPDSFEHMPTVGIRMPNGALSSLAGNVDPHHRVAVGGYDPSLAPEAYTDGPAPVDFIVRGEGELTFRDLVRALERGSGLDAVAGLSYGAAGTFHHNPDRPVHGLGDGEIRPPNRDARVLQGYEFLGRQVDVVETSRGCTFDC